MQGDTRGASAQHNIAIPECTENAYTDALEALLPLHDKPATEISPDRPMIDTNTYKNRTYLTNVD